MKTPDDVVFLLDVDNTLLDNDRVIDELRNHLECEFGPENRNRYWAIFEELRAELGYADYLGALQRYRLRCSHRGSDRRTSLSTPAARPTKQTVSGKKPKIFVRGSIDISGSKTEILRARSTGRALERDCRFRQGAADR